MGEHPADPGEPHSGQGEEAVTDGDFHLAHDVELVG